MLLLLLLLLCCCSAWSRIALCFCLNTQETSEACALTATVPRARLHERN